MVQLQRLKKLGTVAATFGFALLIGFVMQYGDADASRFAASHTIASDRVVPAAGIDPSPLQPATVLDPKTVAPIQLSANLSETVRFDAGSVKLTALVGDEADSLLPDTSVYSGRANLEVDEACPIEMETVVAPEANVELTITSTCRADMAFEIHHSGLVVSGLTDDDGAVTLMLPALEVNSAYAVTFEDGWHSSTSLVVPEAANYNRVVLQWADRPAEYMRYDATGTTAVGSVIRLGLDTAASNRFAEIYTVPTSHRFADGLQNLAVQADVTQSSCGRDLVAERFFVMPDTEITKKDIRITLPNCDLAGTYLELKKVLGGQTLLP